MNFARQTRMQYEGQIDEGYHVVEANPAVSFKPKVIALPDGVEASVGGDWHQGRVDISGPTALPGKPFTFHIRNLMGHAVVEKILLLGLSPKDPKLGRRVIVGHMRVFEE